MILEVDLHAFLLALMYIALIILIVVLIILAINAIKTIKKANVLLDDVQNKVSKLDGMFNMVDNFSDAVSTISDKISGFVCEKINELVNKKKGNE